MSNENYCSKKGSVAEKCDSDVTVYRLDRIDILGFYEPV